ncbi:MAG: ABC transporter ATP-binding protein [Acidimicrobiia bacterium]|nr:ABC transporter ATP-binding protein [Acidimicrobiia bacterium]
MGGDSVVVCRDLRRRFGDRVGVDGVGFEIARGETYGLLGPNGAGKTTTISMLCGLLAPDEGEVIVAGRPITPSSTDAKRAIGLVPQDIALYPDLTARENLRFFGRLQGLGKARLAARMGEVLELVGLADRADDRVEHYSGGMKRRCNIAAGLLHEPELLVLDEPTVGVDPQSRNAILESIEELGRSGLSVLYTTHYMEEAERLCDRVGILDEGRLVAEGTRRELIAHVGHQAGLRVSGTGDLHALAAEFPGAVVRDGAVDLLVDDTGRRLAEVVGAAERVHVVITGIDTSEPDLEAVFLHLTGKALRD